MACRPLLIFPRVCACGYGSLSGDLECGFSNPEISRTAGGHPLRARGSVNTSRRQLLALASVCAVAPRLRATADLPGFYYRDYSKCLPDYLASLARAAYEKRNR